jgi:hypothetical protein
MKLLSLIAVLFCAVFLFFEIDEYDRYNKNIKIEKSPTYTVAQFDGVSKVESKKSKHISYFLKYKFKTNAGEFSGSTRSLTETQVAQYLSAGTIDIVYSSTEPSFNTVKTYFRPGQTTKEYQQSFVISGLLGLVISIPFGLLLGWKFGWLKRKKELSA